MSLIILMAYKPGDQSFCSQFQLSSARIKMRSILIFFYCFIVVSVIAENSEIVVNNKNRTRTGRFFGLLGLLTGLGLAESFSDSASNLIDDEGQHGGGFIKISIGRPPEAFNNPFQPYPPYFYNPLIPSINIKIPLKNHHGPNSNIDLYNTVFPPADFGPQVFPPVRPTFLADSEMTAQQQIVSISGSEDKEEKNKLLNDITSNEIDKKSSRKKKKIRERFTRNTMNVDFEEATTENEEISTDFSTTVSSNDFIPMTMDATDREIMMDPTEPPTKPTPSSGYPNSFQDISSISLTTNHPLSTLQDIVNEFRPSLIDNNHNYNYNYNANNVNGFIPIFKVE